MGKKDLITKKHKKEKVFKRKKYFNTKLTIDNQVINDIRKWPNTRKHHRDPSSQVSFYSNTKYNLGPINHVRGPRLQFPRGPCSFRKCHGVAILLWTGGQGCPITIHTLPHRQNDARSI